MEDDCGFDPDDPFWKQYNAQVEEEVKAQKTARQTERIAELNDRCRTSKGKSGRRVMTVGIGELPFFTRLSIADKVAEFDQFTEGDNPNGERDFGAFEYQGRRIFWKIDYYDPSMEYGSEDPADPEKTVRVLTIMLADEY